MLRKREGDLIGFCGFKELPDYVDFGWRYAYHVWRRGYASEAALHVLEYGLKQLKLKNISAGSFTENVGSVKIIQKLGFKHAAMEPFYGKTTIRYYQSRDSHVDLDTNHCFEPY